MSLKAQTMNIFKDLQYCMQQGGKINSHAYHLQVHSIYPPSRAVCPLRLADGGQAAVL